MMITVQSLSTKAAVGMVAEDNFNGSVGPVYVFSAAQKYRLVSCIHCIVSVMYIIW
jgi:hypothetical protein